MSDESAPPLFIRGATKAEVEEARVYSALRKLPSRNDYVLLALRELLKRDRKTYGKGAK